MRAVQSRWRIHTSGKRGLDFLHYDFDGAILSQAIAATFTGRGATIPAGEIYALTAQFSLDAARQRLWTGSLKRLELKYVDKSFHVRTNQIAVFVNPPL